MTKLKRWLVWLSRIHHCMGFGIQSPTDYAFVRNVVNEHWPYYAYENLTDADWKQQKIGRLYFRLANWCQPNVMLADSYQRYWHAGCRKTQFVKDLHHVELARVDMNDEKGLAALLSLCDEHSVLVVEDIWRNPAVWKSLQNDERVSISYDLYYCGILLFQKKRYKSHYIINF
jgi:hypothetical protein